MFDYLTATNSSSSNIDGHLCAQRIKGNNHCPARYLCLSHQDETDTLPDKLLTILTHLLVHSSVALPGRGYG
jgi:hypothetical protein